MGWDSSPLVPRAALLTDLGKPDRRQGFEDDAVRRGRQDALVGKDEWRLVFESGTYGTTHPADQLQSEHQEHANTGNPVGLMDIKGVQMGMVFHPPEGVLGVVRTFIGLMQLAHIEALVIRNKVERRWRSVCRAFRSGSPMLRWMRYTCCVGGGASFAWVSRRFTPVAGASQPWFKLRRNM